jgi:hypothetical protein
MTIEERDTAAAAILTQQDRITKWGELQAKIERLETAKGHIRQVNFIDAIGPIATSDTDMLLKAELAIAKLANALKAEQAAL